MISILIKKFAGNDIDSNKRRARCGFICGGAGIFLNLVLFFLKLMIGTFSGSVSITADAFNNLTDAGSGAVTLFGFFWSGREADTEHPFGHGRIEYLSGIIISFIIIIVGFELLKASVSKIFSPQEMIFNRYVVIVLLFSIAIKLYMALYNSRVGKSISSLTLAAASSDSLSDCIATGAVLISSVIMYFTSLPIDGYVGAVVSVLIMRTGIKSVMDTASPLLGNAPDGEFVKEIEKTVMTNPEAVGIHDLVVHDYGPNKRFVSLHMEVDGSKDIFLLHDAVDIAERELISALHCEAVIHMDPIDLNNPHLQEISEKIKARARSLCSGLNVHDIRMVPGTTHTNIIFDCLIPAEEYNRRDEFTSELEKYVKEIDENYFAVITAEQSYC